MVGEHGMGPPSGNGGEDLLKFVEDAVEANVREQDMIEGEGSVKHMIMMNREKVQDMSAKQCKIEEEMARTVTVLVERTMELDMRLQVEERSNDGNNSPRAPPGLHVAAALHVADTDSSMGGLGQFDQSTLRLDLECGNNDNNAPHTHTHTQAPATPVAVPTAAADQIAALTQMVAGLVQTVQSQQSDISQMKEMLMQQRLPTPAKRSAY
jgi:hypothetical protein